MLVSRYLWPLFGVLLFAQMALMLVVQCSYNVFAFLLLIISLVVVLLRLGDTPRWDKGMKWLLMIWLGGITLAFLHVLIGGESMTIVERPIKMLFALPIMLAVMRMRVRLEFMAVGTAIGAVAAAVSVGYQHQVLNMSRVANDYNPIPFSEVAMAVSAILLAVALVSGKRVAWLYLLGSVAALYCVVISESRGTLLAIVPVVVLLLFVGWSRRDTGWWRWSSNSQLALSIVVLLCVLIGIGHAWKSSGIGERLSNAVTALSAHYDDRSKVTSAGIRLELWHSVLISLEENPIRGVGNEDRRQFLRDLEAEGRVYLSNRDWPHAHNDFLDMLQRYGIPRMLFVVLLYSVLFVRFWRSIRDSSGMHFGVALAGLLSLVVYASSSMTDVPLRNSLTLIFFTVHIAVLLGLLRRYECELD